MNRMQIFNNPEFGEVRTVEIDGEPWFVGKDVAVALGYERPTDAVRKHADAEDRGIAKIETPSGVQEMVIINESGVYSLIFSSKLPGAKAFKHWVTSEVLPALRKHGTYTTPAKEEADFSALSPQLQVLINLETEQRRQAEKLDAVEQKVDGVRELVALSPNGWRKDGQRLVSKIANAIGGVEHIRDVNTEVYNLVNERARVNLETRLSNKRRRLAEEGTCKSKRDKLNRLDVIAEDPKLIEIYTKIVREMAIRYGVV